MTRIRTEDISSSVADALQYISYYHPPDFVEAMTRAYENEISEPAKNAIAQILINSRMAAEGHRPVCQDTGIVVVFVKLGQSVVIEGDASLQDAIDEGVRRAYTDPDNPLRASVISPPIGDRKNTGDNTPAVVHTEIVPGEAIEITVAAKGGGSENKAKLAMLNPSDDLADWVTQTLPTWAPAGVRRAFWASASAARRKKPCCWRKSPSWPPSIWPKLWNKGQKHPLKHSALRFLRR